jgi:hypothetical protein
VFDELALGKIHHIDIIARKNERGEPFKRVYIHFEKWFWNETAKSTRTKLVSGKEIKIVYDNPWFWKVSVSKWTPSAKEPEHRRNARPYIGFDDIVTPLSIAPPLVAAHIAPTLPRQVDEFGRSVAIRNQREDKRPQDKRPQDKRPQDVRLELKRIEKPIETPVEIDPLDPRSPSCSPRRWETKNEDEIPNIDYGFLTPKKIPKLQQKRVTNIKKDKPELCEVNESVELPVEKSNDPLYADL